MKKKIQEALKKALKQKKELEILTLRQLLAVLKNAEIDKHSELNDKEIAEIILQESKKRQEAIELYKKGNREDLAKKEEKEIKILKQFMPKMLSEADLAEIIEKAINELQATPQDFGKVMSKVMPLVKGRTEGSKVAEIVKQKLDIK